MQKPDFDAEAARQNLQRKELAKSIKQEEFRIKLLQKAIEVLLEYFRDQKVEVWLIGSIIQPNHFSERSDIDIVVKNFHGDRFALWSILEKKIGHEAEIVRFEECSFQDDILTFGKKVL